MKKAASLARRNGRRKNDEPENTKQESQRRKPSAEEAALTAKNYRLAKELVCGVVLSSSDGAVKRNLGKLTEESLQLGRSGCEGRYE